MREWWHGTLSDKRFQVRRVAYNVNDGIRGEMIYHCDKHISGPHRSLSMVPEVLALKPTLSDAK